MSGVENKMELYPESKSFDLQSWKDLLLSKKGLMWLALIVAIILAFYWYCGKKSDSYNFDLDIPLSAESPVSDFVSSVQRL